MMSENKKKDMPKLCHRIISRRSALHQPQARHLTWLVLLRTVLLSVQLVPFKLLQGKVAVVQGQSTVNLTQVRHNNSVTKYPDRTKLNPYEEGCLYSHGIQPTKRTCSSDDTDTADAFCSLNEMNYMEIRIVANNWESTVYEAWLFQILLSELLQVPTTIEAGRGELASLNFYNTNADYEYGVHTTYESLKRANSIEGSDCTLLDTRNNPNITCAHVIPEIWKGNECTHIFLDFSIIANLIYLNHFSSHPLQVYNHQASYVSWFSKMCWNHRKHLVL
jgi:hypothetical protein